MSQNNDLNILHFYDDPSKREVEKWWSQGRHYPTEWPVNRVPQFQITRTPSTGAPISSAILINKDTGIETTILNRLNLTGLEVAAYTTDDDDYDKIIYLGTIGLGLSSIDVLGQEGVPEGIYELVLSDGQHTWYSEYFKWCADLSSHVLLEYWHCDDFDIPAGRIRYLPPYKTRVYLNSSVAKPTYEYEERVVRKGGANHPVQQISWKEFRFTALLPENVLDAIRVARQHDNVEIRWQGRTFIVDELLMNRPVWQDDNMVAEVEFEFKTDTIVITNGRGVEDCSYEVAKAECVPADYVAVTQFSRGSENYENRQYFDRNNNNQLTDLQNGDHVIIRESDGTRVLARFNFGTNSYIPIALTDKQVVYDQFDHYFWWQDSLVLPFVSSYVATADGYTLQGQAFEDCLVEVFVLTKNGTSIKVGEGFEDTFNTGLTVKHTGAIVGFVVVCTTPRCYRFQFGTTFMIEPECLQVDWYARASIQEWGADYANRVYNDGSGTVPMADGDIFVVETTLATKVLRRYSAGTDTFLTFLLQSSKRVIYTEADQMLYFEYGQQVVEPYVEDVEEVSDDLYRIRAQTFLVDTVEVVFRKPDNSEETVAFASEDELRAGVLVYYTEEFNAVKIVSSSDRCAQFHVSEWFELRGIGFMAIEDGFIIQ